MTKDLLPLAQCRLRKPNAPWGSTLFFQLQSGLVFFQELFYVVCRAEQAVPLLVIQRNRETAKSVNTDTAFFADLEDQIAAALLDFYLIFQLGQTGFEFFVGWFRHSFPR